MIASDTIRVLCIGNSFSWDAVEQELAPLCQAGKQPIIIGNLYYGGCSLQQHHNFLLKDTAAYSFRYIKEGIRTVHEGYSLRQALLLDQWDYISFQQASHDSGIQSTYEPYLGALIDSVRKYQPHAQFCWMQTWSYSQDAKHPAFPSIKRVNRSWTIAYILPHKRYFCAIPNSLSFLVGKQSKLLVPPSLVILYAATDTI